MSAGRQRRLAAVACALLIGCGRLGFSTSAADAPAEPLDVGAPDAPGTDLLDAALADVPLLDAALPDAPLPDAPLSDAFLALDAPLPDAFAPLDAALDAYADDAFVPPTWLCPFDTWFCDSYEAGAARWSYTVIRNGTADPSFTLVHSGAASLRCASDGAMDSEARYSADVFARQTSGEIWTRFYFLLPSTVIDPVLSIESISERAAPYRGVQVFIEGDAIGVRGGSTGASDRAAAALPRDRWLCIETHLTIDVGGSAEVYVDGVGAASITTDTTLPTGYDVTELGLHFAAPGNPIELYVDDAAFGRSRQGCM